MHAHACIRGCSGAGRLHGRPGKRRCLTVADNVANLRPHVAGTRKRVRVCVRCTCTVKCSRTHQDASTEPVASLVSAAPRLRSIYNLNSATRSRLEKTLVPRKHGASVPRKTARYSRDAKLPGRANAPLLQFPRFIE